MNKARDLENITLSLWAVPQRRGSTRPGSSTDLPALEACAIPQEVMACTH